MMIWDFEICCEVFFSPPLDNQTAITRLKAWNLQLDNYYDSVQKTSQRYSWVLFPPWQPNRHGDEVKNLQLYDNYYDNVLKPFPRYSYVLFPTLTTTKTMTKSKNVTDILNNIMKTYKNRKHYSLL